MTSQLTQTEIEAAISMYIGSEYKLNSVKITVGRGANASKIEIDTTRILSAEPTTVNEPIKPIIKDTEPPFDLEADTEILEEPVPTPRTVGSFFN